LIGEGHGTLFAIGDPDQAIYGFRGADLSAFLRFFDDFPGAAKVVLKKNYRSTPVICESSAALMMKEVPLEAARAEDIPIGFAHCQTAAEEAEMVVEQIEKLMGGTTYFSLDSGRVDSHEGGGSFGFGDIAVLYRLNAQGDILEEALTRAGIPMVRSGERPLVGRYPANLLWRFLQTCVYPGNPYYAESYLELVREAPTHAPPGMDPFADGGTIREWLENAIARHHLGCDTPEEQQALERLRRLAEQFPGDAEAFLDTLSLERGRDNGNILGDRVALMSIHSAKGLEWPVVFITGCEDGLIPCTLFGDRDDEEEKRLFYVGLTRAKTHLILSRTVRRNPSPFLSLIPPKLCAPLQRTPWKRKPKAHKQLNLF
jgi:DNA helicase-2/ATP-dependent DNA helicase PcrA